MDNAITNLSYIGLAVAIIGIVVVIMISAAYYIKIKKAYLNGEFKEYTQTYLSNTDVSIGSAVEHLKIVNSSMEVDQKDE